MSMLLKKMNELQSDEASTPSMLTCEELDRLSADGADLSDELDALPAVGSLRSRSGGHDTREDSQHGSRTSPSADASGRDPSCAAQTV